MKKYLIAAGSIAGLCMMLSGCASTQVQRHETGGADSITTFGINMADFMNAAQRMSSELVVHPSIAQFQQKNGRLARVDVGSIINATRDRITIEQISERVTEALLDSGQVTVVAHDAGAVRSNDRDAFLSDKAINNDGQADFYLEGTISKEMARAGSLQEETYTFQMRLNDRNRSQVWKRSVDITKQGKNQSRR